MEILIAAVVSLAAQVLKKVESRIGGNATLVLVFVLCFVGVAVYTQLEVHFWDFLQQIATTFGVAVGVYEVVLKRLPSFGKRGE